jgi:PAS domain S-box-containing protein
VGNPNNADEIPLQKSTDSLESINILYVDDEVDILELVKLYLEKKASRNSSYQYYVTTVNKAEEALMLLDNETTHYDIIISDYKMGHGKLDGLDFLEKLRTERNNQIPFIIFTGRGREEVVIDALNKGADFYIQKSAASTVLFAELVHYIEKAVSRVRSKEAIVLERQKLIDSEEKFRMIFHHATDAFFISNVDFEQKDIPMKIIEVNDVATRLLHCKREDLIDSPFEKIIYTDSHEYLKDHLAELFTQGFCSFEIDMLTKDEIRIPVEMRCQTFILQDQKVIMSVAIDITERRQMQAALFDTIERYRSTINTMHEGLFVTNKNGIITYVNDAFTKLIGLPFEAVVGQPFSELLDLFEEVDLDADFSNDSTIIQETLMKDTKGNSRWVLISTSPYFSEQGSFSGALTVITDITNQKEVELKLEKQKQELEFLLDVLTHDLRNYGLITKGYAELLEMMTVSPDIKSIIEKLNASITRTNTVLSTMSALMKSQVSDSDLEVTSLLPILKSAETTLRELYPTRNIVVNYDLPKDTLILADSMLSHVIINIIKNSVEHNKEVEIVIDISIDASTDKMLNIAFSDYGQGIDPEVREEIVQRFKKGKTSKGTGVGLSIVNKLVKLRYNGDLLITDRVAGDWKKGAKFIIKLQKPKY